MKILLLCHIEEMFRGKPHGFSESFVRRVVKQASNGYDKIVCMTSMIDDMHPIEELIPLMDQEIEWGWGYEAGVGYDPAEECPSGTCKDWDCDCWVIDSCGHEYTWIPTEFRDWRYWDGNEIFIGGGANGECLADLESILDHIGIDYEKLYDIVY